MHPYMPNELNVLVMHPDPIVCAGLVAALRQQPKFEVSVFGTGSRPPGAPPVDVVITDYDNALLLSDPDARGACGIPSTVRVLAFTANDRETDIRRAIQSGIHGYLLPGGSLDELVEAVRAVGNGVRYLCVGVAQRMADSLAGTTLTVRENKVLQLVATGQSNKVIARQLAIELGTVKSHVSAIMSKLGAVSRTQAANIAVTRGLIDERQPVRSVLFATGGHHSDERPRFA